MILEDLLDSFLDCVPFLHREVALALLCQSVSEDINILLVCDPGIPVDFISGKVGQLGGSVKPVILASDSRIDPFSPISEFIMMDSFRLRSFDLVFYVRDIPDEEKDFRVVEAMLEDKDFEGFELGSDSVVLNSEANAELKYFYAGLRSQNRIIVSITPAKIQTLEKLSWACARIKGKSEAGVEEAREAIGVVKFFLTLTAVDPKTGLIDIDRVQTDITPQELLDRNEYMEDYYYSFLPDKDK